MRHLPGRWASPSTKMGTKVRQTSSGLKFFKLYGAAR